MQKSNVTVSDTFTEVTELCTLSTTVHVIFVPHCPELNLITVIMNSLVLSASRFADSLFLLHQVAILNSLDNLHYDQTLQQK